MERSVALTLALQVIRPLLLLTFGVACLRVARRPGLTLRTGGWFLSGVTFTAIGGIATLHSFLAIWAVAAGEGSTVYTTYMRLQGIPNVARSVLAVGYSAALAALVFVRRPLPGPRQVAAGVVALLAAGALVGWAQGDNPAEAVLWLLSLLEAVSLFLLLIALYRALVVEAFDYLLWTAIAVYAAREAINFNFLSMTIWYWWTSSVQFFNMVSLISAGLMTVCALRRIALERAGREVPSFMERVAG